MALTAIGMWKWHCDERVKKFAHIFSDTPVVGLYTLGGMR